MGFLLAVVAFASAACRDSNKPTETSPFIDIIIEPPTPVVAVDQQITLTARVTGPPGVSQAVFWTAVDPDFVGVTAAGVVTGRAEGAGRVQATWNADPVVSRQIQVQVTGTPIEGDTVVDAAAQARRRGS